MGQQLRSKNASTNPATRTRRAASHVVEALEGRRLLAGAWVSLPGYTFGPNYASTMELLPNGAVIISLSTSGPNYTALWDMLRPSGGSYASGTLSSGPTMHAKRLYFASDILPNGTLFAVGAEHTDATNTVANTPEIYDPNNPSAGWQQGTAPSQANAISDSMSEVLADGTVLVGRGPAFTNTILYNETLDPNLNSSAGSSPGPWSTSGTLISSLGNSEAGWVKLADGTLLKPDVPGLSSGVDALNTNFERFVPGPTPGSGQWVSAGSAGVPLASDLGEIGPGALLSDGRVLWIGGTGHTAIYTPPSTLLGVGSWTQGPDLPSDPSNPGQPYGANDTPAAVEPNGKVLFGAGYNSHATYGNGYGGSSG